ncbi:TPA: endolytic transglycosylase MltG [Morganella morganii]
MKKTRIFLVTFLVLLAVAGSVAYWLYHQVNAFSGQKISVTEETIFTIPPGTGRVALEKKLAESGIIPESHNYDWLLQLFVSGKEAQFSIRFVEGSKLADWQKILSEAPYLKQTLADLPADKLTEMLGLPAGSHLEGRFYPDTYLYTAGTEDTQILKRAHQQMETKLAAAWKTRNTDLPYADPYEMLIMASLIEKETGVDGERKKVASVFMNRLKLKMRLQTDPTVIYGMGERYQGTIYRSDLARATPYNTYQIDGMPPTPIAMPGSASLDAAAKPDTTGYLYFVADGKGGHVFTTNLRDHNRAVADYRNGLKKQ